MARAYFIVARLDRRLAALRAVEAVRLHAAAHEGDLPAPPGVTADKGDRDVIEIED